MNFSHSSLDEPSPSSGQAASLQLRQVRLKELRRWVIDLWGYGQGSKAPEEAAHTLQQARRPMPHALRQGDSWRRITVAR